MKVRLLGTAAAVVVLATACGGDSDEPTTATQSASTDVTIDTFQYLPKNLEVAVGTTVTWTDEDAILHTVTSSGATPETFDLKLADKGATASFTFDTPGTYTYVCTVHPGMQGTVTVT